MSLELKSDFTISQLLALYKQNSKAIWIKVTVITSLVVLYSFIKPHVYESNTSLMPPRQSEMSGLSGILQSVSGGLPSGALGGLTSQGSQSQLFSEILKSRAVAELVIDSLHLDKNKDYSEFSPLELIEAVQKMLYVSVQRNGTIVVNVSVATGFFPSSAIKDSTAVLAEKIAETAVIGLDQIVRTGNTSSARKSREYVERELDNYRLKLDSVDAILELFQTENKVLKIDDQTQALVKQAIEVGSQLAKAELELKIALAEFSSDHPVVSQLRSVVKELKMQYESVQSGGLTGTDGFSIPFNRIPNLARQYTNIFREKKIFEQVIMYLETQRHQEAIQESRDVPVVQILDHAFVPEHQTSPSKKMMFIMGFVLSFVFVYAYHFVKYVYKQQKTA